MEKFIAWAAANKVIVGIALLVLAYVVFGGGDYISFPTDK